ncbi:MucB/RseB C-terminal domain-containing protein [Comamonas serinivorans]|nr:MucB/RseB C-terminal domain-containing protein [Comamonas serinivorans]
MTSKRFFLQGMALVLGAASLPAVAKGGVSFGPAGAPDWSMETWTALFRKAPKEHSFKGVFIVSMPNVSSVSSSRITHVVHKRDVIERIEALTGQQRITYRRNAQATTVFPDAKIVRHEQLGAQGGVFPGAGDRFKAASAHYRVAPGGRGRIAGFETYTVDFRPLDGWRFGYRVWSDVKTGLVLKLQTLGSDGSVIEQSEFSELALDPAIKADALLAEMQRVPPGYKVVRSKAAVTTPAGEGWSVQDLPAGFEPVTCYKREPAKAHGWLQCVFSDGMASVSIFLERYDPERHRQEGHMSMGATHTLVTRSVDANKTEWWATVVGEVPTTTLRGVLKAMERLPGDKPARP